ncbi:hypothetical protein J3E72DRAFT_307672 [Bipolaris maydis]|nr:hypothetical protein J3E72DRAFT_307672 [Bipolaris maydis]KAJ6284198.1 hypothetical protein J3E71DRAFT_276980 [Bipolaris maydis]
MESSSGFGPKVAIPRLKRPNQQTVFSKSPRISSERVSQACNRCRRRKLKCSGTRPRCTNCTKYNEDCIYHLPRRDRLREAAHKIEVLSTLLEDIRSALDDENTKRIDDVLKEFEDDTPPLSPSVHTKSWKKRLRQSSPKEADCDRQAFDKAHVSSSVGSNEDLDFLEEDVPKNLRPTEASYMGRNSQIAWMTTLQRNPDQHGRGQS